MKVQWRRTGWKRFAGAVFAGVIAMMSLDGTGIVRAATTSGEDVAVREEALHELAKERDIMGLVYLCDELDVHGEASATSAVTGKLSSGQTVFVQDCAYNETEGMLWIRVEYQGGENRGDGYIPRWNLACSDERFLSWEKQYEKTAGNVSTNSQVAGASSTDPRQDPYVPYTGVSTDIAQFPESYQAGLTELKKNHPQWVFVPMKTGLDWSTVITEELKDGKSLVYKTFPDYTKDGAYDDGNWYYATRGILEYYMDPRNAMTEDRMFQFELLTYNETYHTEAAVESFLNNTFMKSPGKAPGTVMTFAHIFWAIGAEEGREVSPFHLAARVYQEQGSGTSPLISGTYPGYEGYYNYFNVGATGTTTEQVIVNGLKYAKDHGWEGAYYSILGGADVISANYIKKGQDTLYLQKFNVNPNASNKLYTHQYMQNISAPTTEGASMKKLYANANSLDNSFVFKIPVYENMPSTACPYPAPSNNLYLSIPSGYDSTVWVDGLPYEPKTESGRQVVELKDGTAKCAVVYSYDSNGVPDGMYVWTLTYQNDMYTVTDQPQLKDLLSYHGFSIRVSGDPGMRVKSGISSQLKNTLISSGVNGFKLKEYGTIVTDTANLTTNPPVIGGSGSVKGVSYGTVSGTKVDKVYETVDGRQRFTSVLVGLPAARYNTVYYFRSYAILTKDSKKYVVYGPTVSKSMSALATQVLNSGAYGKGSEEKAFLEQLLEDAAKD